MQGAFLIATLLLPLRIVFVLAISVFDFAHISWLKSTVFWQTVTNQQQRTPEGELLVDRDGPDDWCSVVVEKSRKQEHRGRKQRRSLNTQPAGGRWWITYAPQGDKSSKKKIRRTEEYSAANHSAASACVSEQIIMKCDQVKTSVVTEKLLVFMTV